MSASPLASLSATRALLDEFGLATKHRLGQHLLIDDRVVERTMRLAELGADADVLEIGPGIGTLTLALVERAAHVVAIEMDPALEPVLAMHAAEHANLSVIIADALRVEPARIAAELGASPSMLVANLPYNVAATIILSYLGRMEAIERVVVMVQKEVADRITAAPGTKAYGAYTAKLRLMGEVTGRFEVSPRSFMPPPRVDSAVVRIERRERARGAARAAAGRVIAAAFAQRRKTIRNSMAASGFDREALDEALAAADIEPTIRAEMLRVDDFMRLAAALAAGDPEPGAAL